MDETQIQKWLGLPARTRVAEHIREGLADVPAPAPGDVQSHITAYEAFLSVAGRPSAPDRQVYAPWKARCRHGDHEITRLPNTNIWVGVDDGIAGCVKGGLWTDPLTGDVCDRPAVCHEPMPEAGR
jgi:hypothetical protein